ncbi:ligase-associated DNA damage response endonuclease PdeM [Primorskyibacter sp. S187A]|uniref:ligase-associated DNA damage response endonuclease PdeM n=1 Tax=Primorskyibacter sp. S187A TaxID=3415130 RepID=UPI003C7BF213
MTTHAFSFCGHRFEARPSGALFWPAESLLCVSDLHLGKSSRAARRWGVQLPPYDVQDTLQRLETEVDATRPAIVLCLGDSFDDLQASTDLGAGARDWILRLQAGRRWIWAEGNHDPGPVDLGGEHVAELRLHDVVFRHIAEPGATGEISGHYHPKAPVRTRARTITRPCFLRDDARVILPAFGTYTGGLRSDADELCALMRDDAQAIVTGQTAFAVPMPRSKPGFGPPHARAGTAARLAQGGKR